MGTKTVTLPTNTPQGARQEQILDTLRKLGGQARVRLIHETITKSGDEVGYNAIHATVAQMAEDNKLSRVGRGVYALPGTSTPKITVEHAKKGKKVKSTPTVETPADIEADALAHAIGVGIGAALAAYHDYRSRFGLT